MYSNISQILLLFKTCEYYNKFDSTNSVGVYHWYAKISQCGYMEHGLKYAIYCVLCYKKPTYNTISNLLSSPTSSRQAAMSTRICETRLSSHPELGWLCRVSVRFRRLRRRHNDFCSSVTPKPFELILVMIWAKGSIGLGKCTGWPFYDLKFWRNSVGNFFV